MSEQGLRRPRQVTVAGGIGIAGGFFLLIGVFDTMAETRSVDARDSVADFLSRPPGDGLGLTVAEVLDLWRGLLYVAGGLAATALVLAIYLFQRHNGARIGFTVVAALLLLAMPAIGILPIVLGIAAVGLWSQPARDWFAGRTPQRPALAPSASSHRPPTYEPPTYQPPTVAPPSESQPPPYGQAYGQAPALQTSPPIQPLQQPSQQPGQQPGQQQPAQPYPPVWAPPSAPQVALKRPASVTWAVILTWVFAGLTAMAMALVLLFIAIDRSGFEAEIERQMAADPQIRNLGLSVDELIGVVLAACGVVAFWAVSAVVIAFFAFRRHVWARILLGASAAASAALSLVAILGVVPLLTLIPSVVTVVLLFSRSASAWYAGRPSGSAPARREQPW
ncbi:MAG TPA: hypothetical protein VFK41_10095 [Nocardioidaceae bacterium]|nr:hypothetical protein [Nocardioidaceae bacterium]